MLNPEGAFYIMIDLHDLDFETDFDFCRYLTKKVGVTAIPQSVFYGSQANTGKYARFAFCKTDDVLQKAAKRLLRASFR